MKFINSSFILAISICDRAVNLVAYCISDKWSLCCAEEGIETSTNKTEGSPAP
jgi:hypothetical protein